MKKFFIFLFAALMIPAFAMAIDPNAPDRPEYRQELYKANPTLDAQEPYLKKARFYLEKHIQGHEIDPATSRPYLEEAYEAIKIARVMSDIKQALASKD